MLALMNLGVRAAAAALSVLFALAACGDDGDSSGSDTTSAGEVQEPGGNYEPCTFGCAAGLECQSNNGGQGANAWCGAPCDPNNNGSDCPAPPPGGQPFCDVLEPDMPICGLRCSTLEPCPDGMTCKYQACGYE